MQHVGELGKGYQNCIEVTKLTHHCPIVGQRKLEIMQNGESEIIRPLKIFIHGEVGRRIARISTMFAPLVLQ